jgi:hypothetical protein
VHDDCARLRRINMYKRIRIEMQYLRHLDWEVSRVLYLVHFHFDLDLECSFARLACISRCIHKGSDKSL